MEGLESFHTQLEDFQQQAVTLAETAISLGKSFEAEAVRISKEDGVQRLEALHTKVVENVKQLEMKESAAKYGSTQPIYPSLLSDLRESSQRQLQITEGYLKSCSRYLTLALKGSALMEWSWF